MKMTCPICGEETCVRASHAEIDIVARRRKCKNCGHIFYTLEQEDKDAQRIFTELDYKSKNYECTRF